MSDQRYSGGSFRQRAGQHSQTKMPKAPETEDPVEIVEELLQGGWVKNETYWSRAFSAQEKEMVVTAERAIEVRDLSPDQAQAFQDIRDWFEGRKGQREELTLGGLAGTGKSTIVAMIAKHFHVRAAFMAYTGKAASVLKQKLQAQGARPSYVGTIHGLIYVPVKDENENNIGFKKREALDYDLLVVDEASMVTEKMHIDLLSFGIPVLFVGDHGQLPPVEGEGFDLMQHVDVRLEKIHRQAAGNPIIALAHYIREYGELPMKLTEIEACQHDDRVLLVHPTKIEGVLGTMYYAGITDYELSNITLLSYTNWKRQWANNLVRNLRWGATPNDPPRPGDMAICLRNAMGLYNGMRGRILSSMPMKHLWYWTHLVFDEEFLEVKAMCFKEQFNREKTIAKYEDVMGHGFRPMGWQAQLGMLFDYGYAMTVHKSQGSSFKNVFILYERPNLVSRPDWTRWLYTACTRASECLSIVTR